MWRKNSLDRYRSNPCYEPTFTLVQRRHAYLVTACGPAVDEFIIISRRRNSICFSPDGHTMYYCDSPTRTIRCCDYDTDAGTIGNDRLFADLQEQPGEPDGSTIDSAGYLWNARWGGHRVLRYAPDGSIERIVQVPVAQPSCVAFGGAALDTLYITSARESLSDAALLAEPAAGGVLQLRLPDVRGLPEARFRD
nr:SMP-30/gluconolactonase/LRE family protein [Collimonas antrihumi]